MINLGNETKHETLKKPKTNLSNDRSRPNGAMTPDRDPRQDRRTPTHEDVLADDHGSGDGLPARRGSESGIGAQALGVDRHVRSKHRPGPDAHPTRIHDRAALVDANLVADLDVVSELAAEGGLDSDAFADALVGGGGGDGTDRFRCRRCRLLVVCRTPGRRGTLAPVRSG